MLIGRRDVIERAVERQNHERDPPFGGGVAQRTQIDGAVELQQRKAVGPQIVERPTVGDEKMRAAQPGTVDGV